MNIASQAKAKLEKEAVSDEAANLKKIADKFDSNVKKEAGSKQKKAVEIRRKLEDIELVKELRIDLEDL
tara:strand:- start:305 stop:511 length:207 start_codon:yes stop_codon:yes gene_type:complete